MSTINDPAFDFEAFFDNITDFPPEETEVVQNKLQEKEKWNLLRKKIVKVHVAISKSHKIRSELAEKEEELSKLRNNNKDLLVKYLPLEKKYSELQTEFSKVKAECLQNEAELEASQCHLKQLQALVKDLETKLEATSLEKSLLNKGTIDEITRKKHIKHIIMFGKLAASQNKLSISNLKILNKYLHQVGENDYESDKDIDNMAMPPSCSSVDTGIGSSLAQSEDEKIWSPDSQFSQSVTYEAATDDHDSCCDDTTQTSNSNSVLDLIPKQIKTSSVLEDVCHPAIKTVFDVNSNATEETTLNDNIFDLNLQEKKSEVYDTTKTSERKPKSSKKAIPAPNPLSPKTGKQTGKITAIGINTVIPEKTNSVSSPRFPRNKLLDATKGKECFESTSAKKLKFCKTKYSPVGPKQKSERKSRIIDMLFDHTKATVENNASKLVQVNCDEMSSDSEVENILKDMNISSRLILSPMPPTPLNVQQVLKKKSLKTQPLSNVKKPCKRLNNAKSPFSQKIHKLQLINYKLNKVICRQRRQLLTANRIILKSKKNILGSTEDDFVRLLSLMSKVSSRFNIEEKKNDWSTAHKFPFSNGNIFEKMCSFAQENENFKEFSGTLDSPVNHSNILKTFEVTTNEMNENNSSIINNEHETTTKMIVQDKEISSADCMFQENSTNRQCFNEIQSGRSSPASGENQEEMVMMVNKKVPKRSKMSKLEKLKSKLKRKPKINVDVPPAKKSCKSMDVAHSICIPTNNETKSSIELNNKIAYEKAVRVMSELKVKDKTKKCSFQDNLPRLTRSCVNIKGMSKSSSLSLDTSNLSSKVSEVTHTDNPDGIEHSAFKLLDNMKRGEKEQDLTGKGDNVRSLRSKTRKSTESTGNYDQKKLNTILKVNTDLDAGDQPIKESRKDELDYSDLAMFGSDEDSQNTCLARSPHTQESSKRPKSKIIKMNAKNINSRIGGKTNCNNSDASESIRQLRSRVTSPANNQAPGISSPKKPFTVQLLDTLQNDTCSQDSSALNPQLKSPPIIRSVTSEITRLMDGICNNTTTKIITTKKDFQHKNELDVSSPNKSLENEKGTYFPPQHPLSEKQVNGISNDCSGKPVEIDENKNQHFFKSMLAKYGVNESRKLFPPNIPENITKEICMQMEKCLGEIVDVMPTQLELDALVARLETKNYKFFIVALLEFLTSDQRSKDILCKAYSPPLPPMTKSEQALLYVLNALQKKWNSIDLFNEIMKNIEYKLFRLGHTPFVTQVENLSHFYAVLCRFRKSMHRLRLFMVDAMYCINFTAIPLIKQCIDVWMHVLPLSHMRSAKNPLVLTIVYLVFYFRSNDPKVKNTKDVDHLKFILTKRYSFLIENFTQQILINKLRECIMDLPAKTKEGRKVLSTALILLTKRNGVKWCQKTIVDGMLIPLIKSKTTPEPSKVFSISVLGSLLKPYPDNMKLHCEMVVNQLLLLMEQNSSFAIEQAILISLILLRRHNRLRPLEILQSWKPQGKISLELEYQVKVLIQEQPLKHWIKSLCDKSSL